MKYLAFLTLILALPVFAHATTTDVGFVPLTNIPLLTETGNSFSLDTFLNGLYRLAIGAAAVIAVIQIMRAGIMYMGGDSVTEKKEARNLIGLAIGGLILVLSPVVVFSVINPEILSLKIGNISGLTADTRTTATKATDNICSAYTSTQFVNIPDGGTCSSALNGGGWVKLDDACCAGTAGSTASCCGMDKNYVAPTAPATGAYHFKFITRDTEPPACQLPEETRYSATKTACISTLSSVSADPNTVITEDCDNVVKNPPTPSDRWNEIKTLPTCDT